MLLVVAKSSEPPLMVKGAELVTRSRLANCVPEVTVTASLFSTQTSSLAVGTRFVFHVAVEFQSPLAMERTAHPAKKFTG